MIKNKVQGARYELQVAGCNAAFVPFWHKKSMVYLLTG
jgi:hypothetical protein